MIKKKYRKGYLIQVLNTEGNRPAVSIAEGKRGYEAYYSTSKRKISGTTQPEKMAVRLAKRGHRSVRILD